MRNEELIKAYKEMAASTPDDGSPNQGIPQRTLKVLADKRTAP